MNPPPDRFSSRSPRPGGRPSGPRDGQRDGGGYRGSFRGDDRSSERRVERDAPRPRWDARKIALEVLARVDDGAYANLALAELLNELDRTNSVDDRDKALATEFVYGTVRMRRACDWLVQRFVQRDPDEETLRVLHLGAYQIRFTRVPSHAAVRETVAHAPEWSQGFANAVLRKVAAEYEAEESQPLVWPDLATELSYPDWIVRTLTESLGAERAEAAMRSMNEPAITNVRDDGYVQDPASEAVAAFVGVRPGDWVLDLCAAPGGKATALAAAGARVTAVELHEHRAQLIRQNIGRLGYRSDVEVIVGDARELDLDSRKYDAVLVDAPCSGLGSLRRRPDARWRIDEDEISTLTELQRDLVAAAAHHVRPGGVVVYSVCTLTDEETIGVDEWIANAHPDLVPEAEVPGGWEPIGRGVRILPGTTDGMCAFRYRSTK